MLVTIADDESNVKVKRISSPYRLDAIHVEQSLQFDWIDLQKSFLSFLGQFGDMTIRDITYSGRSG